MGRRSNYSRAKIDALAFPVRVNVLIPPTGLGSLLDDAQEWLDEHAGRGHYAHHGAHNNTGAHICAWYFRTVDIAHRFFAAFPGLHVADGTTANDFQRETAAPPWRNHGAGYGPNIG